MRRPPSGGDAADVVFVLLLIQAAAGLLAGLGEVAIMGGPLPMVVPVATAVLLVVLGTKVVGGRAWALVTVLLIEGAALAGFWLSVLVGLFPQAVRTVTLTGLLTEIGLPLAVVVLCGGLLGRHASLTGATAGPVRRPTLPLPTLPLRTVRLPTLPLRTVRLPAVPLPVVAAHGGTDRPTVDLAGTSDGLPPGWPRPLPAGRRP